MSANKVERFNDKLTALEKDAGCLFEICLPDFDESIETNRLFADWFDPGTVLARAVTGNTVITYSIDEGEALSAAIESPDGEVIHEFKGKLEPFEDGSLKLANDKDIDALEKGEHPSGCRLVYHGGNLISISVNNPDVGAIIAADPSVARTILNKDYISELTAAVREAEASMQERDASAGKDARKEALREAEMRILDMEEFPEKPISPPEEPEARGDNMIADDIPSYEEYIKEHPDEEVKPQKKKTGKAAKESKAAKEPKKAAKSTKKAVDTSEDAAPADAGEVRFDLLPLDEVSDLIIGFDDEPESELLRDLEAYKSGAICLLDVATRFAKSNYEDATEAVFALADMRASYEDISPEAAVNMSVKEYLLYLRDGDGVHTKRIFGSLFFGALG